MTWKIDPAHSQINFSVRHMMISTVRGEFKDFTGRLDFNEQHPERSWVEVDIQAASIDTNDPDRDKHLRSPDFLDAGRYPTLHFKSKRIELRDDRRARIIGDLTIRDVTCEVILNTEFAGTAKSPWGATSAGFSAEARLNRQDFGLNWNKTLETGGVLVGDEIRAMIELEAVKDAAPEAVAEAESESV